MHCFSIPNLLCNPRLTCLMPNKTNDYGYMSLSRKQNPKWIVYVKDFSPNIIYTTAFVEKKKNDSEVVPFSILDVKWCPPKSTSLFVNNGYRKSFGSQIAPPVSSPFQNLSTAFLRWYTTFRNCLCGPKEAAKPSKSINL